MSERCCTRKGFTYVIECEGHIKIGRARVVASRLRDIQATCPSKVTLLATAAGATLERLLHRMCDEWRLHGEWFEFAAWRHIAHLFAKGVCAACSLKVKEQKARVPDVYIPPLRLSPTRQRRDQSDLYAESAAAKIVEAVRSQRGMPVRTFVWRGRSRVA